MPGDRVHADVRRRAHPADQRPQAVPTISLTVESFQADTSIRPPGSTSMPS